MPLLSSDTPNADINGFKAYNVDGALYSDNKTPSETATGAIFGNDSDASTKDGQKDIFLKTTEISIEEDRNFLREGSIYAEDSDMGNLFKKANNFKVGNSIDVFIKIQGEAKTDEAIPQEENADTLKAKLEELIPNLASDDANKKPITKFKARILRELPNGDLEIESYKSAGNEKNGNRFYRFKATIPKKKYKAAEQLTTNDLENIKWDEVNNGDLTQRTSLAWQDDYTLRMSGFGESFHVKLKNYEREKKDYTTLRKSCKHVLQILIGIELHSLRKDNA